MSGYPEQEQLLQAVMHIANEFTRTYSPKEIEQEISKLSNRIWFAGYDEGFSKGIETKGELDE